MKTLTAAIQFGSSRISAAAAWFESETGTYQVAAVESMPTAGCIRHGIVVNVEEAAGLVKNLMLKMSNRVKTFGSGALDSAYVGVCGLSMRSMSYQPSTYLDEDADIDEEINTQLCQQSMELKVPGNDVLGLSCNSIDHRQQEAIANHVLVVAETRLMQGIHAVMERAHINIAGVMATPLILGDILTNDEKQKGCLLLDLGAQLTTMSIYANGTLLKIVTLPIGSEAVTMDIFTKGVRMDEAEDLKMNWSDASRPTDNIQAPEHCPITTAELNIIVASRYEEIAANVKRQIDEAGMTGQLAGGCILTGGASIQKGLTSLLSKRLGIERICTRSCSVVKYSSSERKPRLAGLMSMLKYCTASCEVVAKPAAEPKPAPEPQPQPEKPETHTNDPLAGSKSPLATSGSNKGTKKSSGIGAFLGDLFSGMDDSE